jgi:hypothetical protein
MHSSNCQCVRLHLLGEQIGCWQSGPQQPSSAGGDSSPPVLVRTPTADYGLLHAFWKTSDFLVSASRFGVLTSGWLYARDSSVRRSCRRTRGAHIVSCAHNQHCAPRARLNLTSATICRTFLLAASAAGIRARASATTSILGPIAAHSALVLTAVVARAYASKATDTLPPIRDIGKHSAHGQSISL